MWDDSIVREVPRIGESIRLPRPGLGVLRLGVTSPAQGSSDLGYP